MAGIMKIKTKLLCSLIVICLTYPLAGYSRDLFDNLPDPTRHKQITKKVVKKIIRQPLTLQSTLISKNYSHAIINNKTIVIGERIEGAKLLAIHPFEVVIEKRGKQYRLPLIAKGMVKKNGLTNNGD